MKETCLSGFDKDRFLEYKKKKAQGLEVLRKNVQSAYSRALEEKRLGNEDNALRWMRRAHHLNRENPGILFDLVMLYFKRQDYEQAFTLLSSLMRKFDFYEGWVTLILIQVVQKSFEDGVRNLQYFLSHYSPIKENWGLLTGLLRKAGNRTGCCGISGSLQELWIEAFSVGKVSVYLDDEFYTETTKSKLHLPAGWHLKQTIRVEQNSVPLVGSPLSIVSLCKVEGGVELKEDQVVGWLWYPSEPTRIPALTIHDSHGNRIIDMQVTEEMKSISLDRPLFRARNFSIPVETLPKDSLSFRDEYAVNLMGSPLNPFLEKEGMAFLAALPTLIQQGKKLDMQSVSSFLPVQAAYRGSQPENASGRGKGIVIVIPIFKGVETTLACIRSVLATLPKSAKIQLVNDGSTDVALCAALENFLDHAQIFYIQHEENRGFPAAVNSGMRAWPDHDMILLNSDTLVGKGWVTALQKAAYQEADVGTVTPLSNGGGIFSYPSHDSENPAVTLETVDAMTQHARKANAGRIIEIPTANGFCMYIRHDCLKQTGSFREDIFAQGYGEENDFCMRARHLGWKHVLAMDVFVGHEGGVSFQKGRSFLMERNIKVLNRLYPGYDRLIESYVQQDEALPLRRKIDLQRFKAMNDAEKKQGKPCRYALFIMHRYQGGVGKAVQERMIRIRSKGIIPIVLQPTLFQDGGELEIRFRPDSTARQEIQELFPNLVFRLPEEQQMLVAFLRGIRIETIEIHHFLGHHDGIRCLPAQLKMEYDIFIHDYYSFCPHIVLLNGDKEYCTDPVDWQSCQACIDSRQLEKHGKEPIDIQEWRLRSRQELEQARNIYVPSQDCYRRVMRHFPTLKQVQVQELEDDRPELSLTQISAFSSPYPLSASRPVQEREDRKRFRICIIGAIGMEKGFGRIHALLHDIEKRDLPLEFVLVGRTRNDELLMRSDRIFITGDYKEEEGIALVSEQAADIAFLPSVFPETWCYTLSVAWRAGLKVVAYDLGAIAERIQNTKRGWLIPLNVTIEQQNDFLLKICKENYIRIS